MYTAALRRSSSQAQSTTNLCSRLHSSAAQQSSKQKHKGSSRTSLAQDLLPKSQEGRFERAPAPHKDPELVKKHERPPRREPVERRREPERSERSFREERTFREERRFKPSEFASRKIENAIGSSVEIVASRLKESSTRNAPPSILDQTAEESEFYHPPSPVSLSPLLEEGEHTAVSGKENAQRLPSTFSSPPLLPNFLQALSSMLGPDARPTPIQALSIKWLIEESGADLSSTEWKQYLLASETGSGKSLAYLLPLLQKLKLDEQNGVYTPTPTPTSNANANTKSKRSLNPRAIILAPTHELSRQLASFTKALGREVKLRALCASRANTPSTTKSDVTAKKLSEQLDAVVDGADDIGEFDIGGKDKYPVDILVGTPVKIMEMIRGRGWDRLKGQLEVDEEGKLPKLRRGRDKMPGVGRWRTEPTLGLENVQWVVVDEADVLFDPDFQEVTRTLLADISAARGQPIEVDASNPTLSSFRPLAVEQQSPATPINYPFNFILTSATIPKNLATYLDQHHPSLVRLTSPRLHHLPKTLQTEYASWTGGNKFADIEHRIRKVWSDDAATSSMMSPSETVPKLSKILIFCNKSTKVAELAEYLDEKGIKSVALTSTSENRKRGSNRHLDGFMRPVQIHSDLDCSSSSSPTSTSTSAEPSSTTNPKKKKSESDLSTLRDPKLTPHVMITTSLLSRGLDFSPDLEHVFIVDEPRNMVDFLHRAGRSGRAGQKGKVVVFTKMKGRGSARSQEVKERVRELIGGGRGNKSQSGR